MSLLVIPPLRLLSLARIPHEVVTQSSDFFIGQSAGKGQTWLVHYHSDIRAGRRNLRPSAAGKLWLYFPNMDANLLDYCIRLY